MKKVLAILALSIVAQSGIAVEMNAGTVACRSLDALQVMRESGGLEAMPEHYIGVACFRMPIPFEGEVATTDSSGAFSVLVNKRRRANQPRELWFWPKDDQSDTPDRESGIAPGQTLPAS